MSSERQYVSVDQTVPTDSQLISISWQNIRVFSKKSKKLYDFHKNEVKSKEIIRQVSGRVTAGQFVAIMGSSGCGKTTLLNALTARNLSNLTVKGVVRVNGRVADAKTITSLSAYVQQFDLFVPILTVKEHLVFQSLLKMNNKFTKEERDARVEELLIEFNLLKCADSRIGNNAKSKGISGGEAKRLAFASELITNPCILFCDEPTSGLDSFMAENIVKTLKKISSEGRTVICTIHQPSSQVFALFEQLILIAEGKVAFMGGMADAMRFFDALGYMCPEKYNPADFYISQLSTIPGQELKCKERTDEICSRYLESSYYTTMEELLEEEKQFTFDERVKSEDKYMYRANPCLQFSAVLWRSFLTTIREPLICRIRLIHSVSVALLFGIVFWQQDIDQRGLFNINAVLFLLIMNMCFQNCYAVFDTFCAEIPLFLREHHNGMYRVDIYFLCKTIADIPIFTVVPFIYMTIMYFMVGLNTKFLCYLIALVVTILVTHCSVSFGYLISCMSSSSTMAMSLGPPLLTPFILFSGFLLNNQSIPDFLTWVKYISWFYYSFESLIINQWKDIDYISCPALSANITEPLVSCLVNGRDVINHYDFDRNHLTRNILSVLALTVFIRVLAFLVLIVRSRAR